MSLTFIFLLLNIITGASEAADKRNAEGYVQAEIPEDGKFLTAAGLLTFYATPAESDFGKPTSEGTELVSYEGPDGLIHRSRFVTGFTSRYSTDPKNHDLSGVAMEGNGFIEPEFHKDDSYLRSQMEMGYGILNLIEWNEKKKLAKFALAKNVLGESGNTLRLNLSAAVRVGDELIHQKDCLAITLSSGEFLGYHFVEDTCSSCTKDTQVDLYMPSTFSKALDGTARIFLMPGGKCKN